MTKNEPKINLLAQKVELAESDIQAIMKSKKKEKSQFFMLGIVEIIVGFFSYLIGYQFAESPTGEVLLSGYPYAFFLIGSSSMYTQSSHKKNRLKVLILIFTIINIVAFVILGIMVGAAHEGSKMVATTFNGTTAVPAYGVYFDN